MMQWIDWKYFRVLFCYRLPEKEKRILVPIKHLAQGRPTRGPRATSAPPEVLKGPAKGFYIGWLIYASALTL